MQAQRSLDLLLVNPGSRIQTYQALGKSLAAIEPPVWAGRMATFAGNHGIFEDVLDANGQEHPAEEAGRKNPKIFPKLAGIVEYGHQPSGLTQIMPFAAAICAVVEKLVPKPNGPSRGDVGGPPGTRTRRRGGRLR